MAIGKNSIHQQKDEILLVDSYEEDRIALVQNLNQEGYIVTSASNTIIAKELISKKYFPVVLIDWEVRPDGALNLINYIKKNSPITQIILLTNIVEFEVAVKGFRAGVIDVIKKHPHQLSRLKQRIAGALSKTKYQDNEKTFLKEIEILLDKTIHTIIELYGETKVAETELNKFNSSISVAIVETEQKMRDKLYNQLKFVLPQAKFYFCVSAGDTLEKLADKKVTFLIANTELPDIEGKIFIQSLKENQIVEFPIFYTKTEGDDETTLVESICLFLKRKMKEREERFILQLLKNSPYGEIIKQYFEIKAIISQTNTN